MFRVADMTLAHLEAVYKIETGSSVVPWSKNELRKEITENQHAVYKIVLTLSGTVAGYGGFWHVVNEAQITNIAVAAPYRRMGVGSLLIDSLIAAAQERETMGITLEVRVSNTAAIKLYEKYGFNPEGIRKGFYSNNKEDAVIMWKYL